MGSQQKVPGSNLLGGWGLSAWRLYVFLSACVSFECFGFLARFRDMFVRLTADSKPVVGVNVCK